MQRIWPISSHLDTKLGEQHAQNASLSQFCKRFVELVLTAIS